MLEWVEIDETEEGETLLVFGFTEGVFSAEVPIGESSSNAIDTLQEMLVLASSLTSTPPRSAMH